MESEQNLSKSNTHKASRFIDFDPSTRELTSVFGYWKYKLVSLKKALEKISDQEQQLQSLIDDAKRNCHYPSKHGLTRDESAAVYLYTMKGDFYHKLNETLRNGDQVEIELWFSYLKLFHKALSKLPLVKGNVWRGVYGDVTNKYQENQELVWWSIISCTSSLQAVKDSLSSDQEYTLFMIETTLGIDIHDYSADSSVQEVILPLGTQLRVISNTFVCDNQPTVQLKDINRAEYRK
jgi:hypothetical protein